MGQNRTHAAQQKYRYSITCADLKEAGETVMAFSNASASAV